MRRTLIAAFASVAVLGTIPAEAALLANCAASTPVFQMPNISTNPPGISGDNPLRPVHGCVADFTTTAAKQVTAELKPSSSFVGTLRLSVTGTNALWTDFTGTFVGGELVNGEGSRTFQLADGNWRLQVQLWGPVDRGYTSVGAFGGSVSDVVAPPPA